jgi:hypothetical protein
MGVDLAKVEVVPVLPDCLDTGRGEELPDDFEGAVIVRFGTIPEPRALEGGGLVIDYRKADSDEVRRVVFAFNDEGMWVAYRGRSETYPSQA